MKKHAYLIMAHKDDKTLEYLLKTLDYEKNDIYLHMDKKSKNIDFEKLKRNVKLSNIIFVKRINVYWGTISIVHGMLQLLKAASKHHYEYYHFLSGNDLPIKSQKYIHNFFEKNRGKEFVHFGTLQYQKDIKSRYDKFHIFIKQIGRERKKDIYLKTEGYFLALQRRLKIDRSKNKNFSIYGGSQWFSITDTCVRLVLKEYKKYWFVFFMSQIPDEMVMQTIIMNSPLKEKLYRKELDNDYKSIQRLIDWDRGKMGGPYIFQMEDKEILSSSNALFARKFDILIDEEIVKWIVDKNKKF